MSVTHAATIDENNAYFQLIRNTWGKRRRQVFLKIEAPRWLATNAGAAKIAPIRLTQSRNDTSPTVMQQLALATQTTQQDG